MIQRRQVLFFVQTEIFQQKYGKKMTILSKSSIVIESGIILTEKMRRKIQQEEERMRGVETRIQEIRHAIFTEVAKMAYDVDSPVEKTIEEIPYRVIPGEVGNFRNDVFLERAIVGERLRLAMGLPCRSAAEHAPISDNIKLADQAETYYTPPLINVIKFACNACHEKRVLITEGCQGCLAHPSNVVSVPRYADTRLLSFRSVRVREPAEWMPSVQMRTEKRISITRNVYPAASVSSTARSALFRTNPRSSR